MKYFVRDQDTILVLRLLSLVFCVIFLMFFDYNGSDNGLNVQPKPVTCYVILLFVTDIIEYVHL
jgi:ABC-type thiamin/hydroxymethylpyrimidine transport system permease subunit